MHQRRQRPHVISEFLTRVAQCLDFGLRRWIGNGQAADFPVGVPERYSGLPSARRLHDWRNPPESNPVLYRLPFMVWFLSSEPD